MQLDQQHTQVAQSTQPSPSASASFEWTPSAIVWGIAKTTQDSFTILRFLLGDKSLKRTIENDIAPQTVWTVKLTLSAAAAGFVSGGGMGARKRSMQFLAENAHRLPKTVGGWYYYHQHKNYAMIAAGGRLGMHYALRFAALTAIFGAAEHAIGVVTGSEGLFCATGAGIIAGTVFSLATKLSWVGLRRALLFGGSSGLAVGIAEELYGYYSTRSIKTPLIRELTWKSFLDGSRWFGDDKPPTPVTEAATASQADTVLINDASTSASNHTQTDISQIVPET